jgi:hypothetical protein
VNALIRAATELQAVCETHRWRFCDWAYVRAQLAPLAELKDAPELMARLERMRADCSPPH